MSTKYILQYHINSTSEVYTYKQYDTIYKLADISRAHYTLKIHTMSNEVEFEYTGIEEQDDVPDNVTIVRFHSSVTEVSRGMFQECKQLKEVVLNEGLRKIGFRSFSHCKQLEHINLPSTVTEIDQSAFFNCQNMREVVLNDGLQTIGKGAFDSCTSLQSIILPSTLSEICHSAFGECGNILEIVLNEGLTKIGDSSFWRCSSLNSITFPSTITKISDRAFCWCSRLKTVILYEGVQMIGKSAFSGCSSLEHITIPSTVVEIAAFTFYGCQRLREVGLHEGIHNIASDSCGSCTSLERFTFPTLSIRMDNIIRAGHTEVENKIDVLRGLVVERRSSGGELFVSVSSPDWEINWQSGDWKTVKEVLGRIDRLICYYELRERQQHCSNWLFGNQRLINQR